MKLQCTGSSSIAEPSNYAFPVSCCFQSVSLIECRTNYKWNFLVSVDLHRLGPTDQTGLNSRPDRGAPSPWEAGGPPSRSTHKRKRWGSGARSLRFAVLLPHQRNPSRSEGCAEAAGSPLRHRPRAAASAPRRRRPLHRLCTARPCPSAVSIDERGRTVETVRYSSWSSSSPTRSTTT